MSILGKMEKAGSKPVAKPAEVATEVATEKPLPRTPRTKHLPCAPHNNPTRWRVVDDPRRAGWEKVYCTVCGKWIGNRPKDLGKKKSRK